MPKQPVTPILALAGTLAMAACHDGPPEADETGIERWTDPPPGPTCGTEWALEVDIPLNIIGARVVAGQAQDDTLAALDQMIDQLSDQGGPWRNTLRGPWRGEPGGLFVPEGTGGVAMASVPEVVIDDEGRYWAYFVDGDLGAMREAAELGEPLRTGWAGVGGLGAAVSEDGSTWERIAPEVTGADVPLFLVDPDILRLPDGRWRMYMLGIRAEEACSDLVDPARVMGPHHIWMAESDDLVHWEATGLAWQAPSGTADPTVWCASEQDCQMLVAGNPDPVSARSQDGGLTFVEDQLGLPSGQLSMPDVARIGDGWWMVAQGDGGILRSLESEDGVTWSASGSPGWNAGGPTVVAAGAEVLVWVHEVEP